MSKVDDVIAEMIGNGARYRLKRGKTVFGTMKIPEPPFRFYGRDERLNCALWKNVVFKHFGFIHSACHSCYKIVVVPNSLNELKLVDDVFRKIGKEGFHCKCGVERRKTVDREYGGYIYCRSEAETDLKFYKVRQMLPDNIKMFAKIGCTEFTLKFGKPETWIITEEQRELEREIDNKIELRQRFLPQTLEEVKRVYKLWKEFSYRHDLIVAPT